MEAMPDNIKLVIFIGPPGSGKDTQANLLVQEYGFVQVPSSRIIRAKFAAHPNDPVIRAQQKIFDEGKLNDPVLVSEWILEFVRPLAAQGKSLVFSGSPRTPYEGEEELPALQKLYGRENVVLIYLGIDLEEIKKRIKDRRFCKANGHPVSGAPEFAHLKVCPIDGSPLERRALDDPHLILTRVEEFTTLTYPVVDIARKFGIPIFNVDGKQTIEGVHHQIANIIERRTTPPPLE